MSGQSNVLQAQPERMPRGRGAARHLIGRFWTEGAALAAAAGAIVLFRATGTDVVTRDAFVFMGFDSDRGTLIVAGLGALLAGGAAGAISPRRLTSAASGLGALGALFWATYADETSRALRTAGFGHFDPAGWLQTTLALIAAAVLLGLAAGALAGQVVGGASTTVRGVVQAWRARDLRVAPKRRLAAGALLVSMVVIAVPVMGLLLNYGPDSLMVAGGAGGVPIIGSGPHAPMPTPVASESNQATQSNQATASARPSASPPPQTSAVWLAWRPQGVGTVTDHTLAAPWTGGKSSTVHFWTYLPPRYEQSARRFPVVYELPWAISLYDYGANIRPMLDSLIDSGQIPASIFVFVTSDGGPFVDNECIDAAGGREPFDTFVGTTLIAYIDATFRTIANADARTLLGSSQGGFCAANVLLHHPTVFHQSVSFSGYYWAAPLLKMAPSAVAAYAGDRALQIANSPMLIADGVPPSLRSKIMFTLIGNPAQAFYGEQLTRFAAYAGRLGFQVNVLATHLGHSWPAVRAELPAALLGVALHEAAAGVFAAQ